MKKKSTGNNPMKLRPALTPEAQENQCIALAMDQARKQLIEGTASSQIICHFLKLGSSEARLDREETEERIKLTKAKTDSYESMKHIEELYANAIDAMRSYGGGGPLDKDI